VTSTTKLTEVLAEVIHRTFCYRGDKVPVCKFDLGDAITMAEVLDKMNLKVVIKNG